MSNKYEVVMGTESGRIMFQVSDRRCLVLRPGKGMRDTHVKNMPGAFVDFESIPSVRPWKGKLTDEEWAMVVQYQLANS